MGKVGKGTMRKTSGAMIVFQIRHYSVSIRVK